MTHRLLLPLLLVTAITIPSASAFLDEIAQLREELQLHETAHAANFSDLVAKYDEIVSLSFNDVEDDKWYYKYVAPVSNWGIVSGYSDATGAPTGRFGPENNVTVAEALKMAFKAAKIDVSECSGAPPVHPQALTHWALSYISCGEQMHVRILTQGQYVNLDRPARRGEVLSIVHDVFGETVPRVFSPFKDTAGNAYEADIAYAAIRGIVSGTGDASGKPTGKFEPERSVTRAEYAKIIYEHLKVRISLQTRAQGDQQG
jgi:S-layer homology domain